MMTLPARFSEPQGVLAVNPKEARRLLGGISETTLWRLVQSKKLRRTSYGTFAVSELKRHLEKEMK